MANLCDLRVWLPPEGTPPSSEERNHPPIPQPLPLAVRVSEVLRKAVVWADGKAVGQSPNQWTNADFVEAVSVLTEILPEKNPLLQQLVNTYWEHRNEIKGLIKNGAWKESDLNRAKELVVQKGVTKDDDKLLADLKGSMQKYQVAALQAKKDHLGAINTILKPLSVGRVVDPNKLTDLYDAVALLREHREEYIDGDGIYKEARKCLEDVITERVRKKFNDPRNQALVKEAIQLLSFSQGPLFVSRTPFQFENTLKAFINANANLQSLPNRSASPYPPVKIENRDSSCFIASWLQLVMNHRLLSNMYKASVPSSLELLEEVEKNRERESFKLTNIGKMRVVLKNGTRGQQDSNEFANAIHNTIEIDKNGKVGQLKLGAKIVERIENLQTQKVTLRPLEEGRPYTFPARQLGFDPNELHPTLDSMVNRVETVTNHDRPLFKTSIHFEEIPELFIYQFTRLVQGRVNRTEVDMPLYHTIETTDGSRGTLQLQGFVRHLGGDKGGHYISYLAQGGKFWLANDDKISEISAADYLVAARHATAALYSTVKRSTLEKKE